MDTQLANSTCAASGKGTLSPLKLIAALALANSYWATRSGANVMQARAHVCATIIGTHHDTTKLTPSDGTRLLVGLARRGLSRKSQVDYYGTFKRVLALQGVATHDWPRGPEPERDTRDPIGTDEAERVMARLREGGFGDTADLGMLLYHSGMRVGVEGLRRDHLQICSECDDYLLLQVKGKGGHCRKIPIVHAGTRALLKDNRRMDNLYRASYRTHLARWNNAVKAEDVKSRLATFHSLRHNYGSRVLEQSGGNLKLVQELLGHSNPGTTARYAKVKTDAKVKALIG